MDAVIQVEGLEKVYRDTAAVKGLGFAVGPGEILGLIGPNGAGKTTTLRALAGILPPTRGSIAVGGHDLRRDPVRAKMLLAYVPDEPHLFESLTVREQILFTARVYGVEGWQEAARELLRRFEMEDKEEALGSELSRGMRQKVATICALLRAPRALLLDEPMTGLDPQGIRTMNQAILDSARGGAAVIISSHLLAMVERLCTRVLVLHRGREVLQGRLDEIRSRFPELAAEASLEEVFFRAVESGAGAPLASPLAGAAEADGQGKH